MKLQYFNNLVINILSRIFPWLNTFMGKIFLNFYTSYLQLLEKKCNIAFKQFTDITLENIIFELKLSKFNFF